MRREIVALAFLQAMDLWTTWRGLHGGAAEQNPVGQALLLSGFTGLVVAKVAGMLAVAAIAWVLWRGTEKNQRQALLGLRVGCCLMLAVVAWNSFIILTSR